MGCIKTATILIDKGAKVNRQNNFGESPLHIAVYYGYKSMTVLLLTKGARVNVQDCYGNTPLIGAIHNGNEEIIKMLLTAGCTTNIVNKDGASALHIAALSKKSIEIFKLLVEHSADVNIRDKEGCTVVHAITSIDIINNRDEMIEWLASINADMNAKDRNGSTPLHYACKGEFLSTIETLISCGADLTIKDNYSQTPLESASLPADFITKIKKGTVKLKRNKLYILAILFTLFSFGCVSLSNAFLKSGIPFTLGISSFSISRGFRVSKYPK